jgi:hypothetical protein
MAIPSKALTSRIPRLQTKGGFMRLASFLCTVLLLLAIALSLSLTTRGSELGYRWRLSGNLSEACTCSVPCTCNFGEDPSPHPYCWAVYSLDIRHGYRGPIQLGGLHLAAAVAAQGPVWYIDERATPQQAEALKAIATDLSARFRENVARLYPGATESPQLQVQGIRIARILQEVGSRSVRVQIGDAGGYMGDFVLGIDGKTPIVVENNWSWNITRGIKGKTRKFFYKDDFGNLIDTKDTNLNQGKFDWNDKTAIYFR